MLSKFELLATIQKSDDTFDNGFYGSPVRTKIHDSCYTVQNFIEHLDEDWLNGIIYAVEITTSYSDESWFTAASDNIILCNLDDSVFQVITGNITLDQALTSTYPDSCKIYTIPPGEMILMNCNTVVRYKNNNQTKRKFIMVTL